MYFNLRNEQYYCEYWRQHFEILFPEDNNIIKYYI